MTKEDRTDLYGRNVERVQDRHERPIPAPTLFYPVRSE